MQTTITVPQAFSVRDEHELYPFQHLMSRLNPQLRVVQVATGVHAHGGCTVFWGLVYQDGQELTQEDVAGALARAGFASTNRGPIQLPPAKSGSSSRAAPAK